MACHSTKTDENGKLLCSIEHTIAVIGGKWKPVILWHLGDDGILRYNELKKFMPGVAHKMLSQQLKELEKNKLISRKQYNEMPPKVEYSLTEKGETIMPILHMMHKWGEDNWE